MGFFNRKPPEEPREVQALVVRSGAELVRREEVVEVEAEKGLPEEWIIQARGLEETPGATSTALAGGLEPFTRKRRYCCNGHMILNGYLGALGCRTCGSVVPANVRFLEPRCRKCKDPAPEGKCERCEKFREEAMGRAGVVCRDCSAPIHFDMTRCRPCEQAFRVRDLMRQTDTHTALDMEEKILLASRKRPAEIAARGAPERLIEGPAGTGMLRWTELEVSGLPYPQPRPKVVGVGMRCRRCKKRPLQRVVSMAGKLGKKCQEWRDMVKLTAIAQGVLPLAEVPLAVEIEFRLEVPKSLLKKDGELTKPAPRWPTRARSGDLDNLSKSTLDALEGVLFDNDSQVVELRARKSWALAGVAPGALIRWRPCEP